jgi:recombination protein RecT
MQEIMKTENDLKTLLATHYMKQINNYFGNEKQAMCFLSGVMAAVQRNPKLLECTPISLVNSFITMAQLRLMPSEVSGEAYVIPYNNSKKDGDKWIKVLEAQFQLGYQGLVTLFYRAGVKSIQSEIVYENDSFSYINGIITHSPDVFSDNRGKTRGAYAIVVLGTGGIIPKVMSAKDIMAMGQRFSKSFTNKDSPWSGDKDPEKWMWKKTVLKQVAKLVPKNEEIFKAIAEDNKDSNIENDGHRIGEAITDAAKLKIGAISKPSPEQKNEKVTEITKKSTVLYPEENIPTTFGEDEYVDEGHKE